MNKLNLKLPKEWYNKILYLIVMIPLIPIKITLPKYKKNRTIKKFFIGIIISTIYIVILNFFLFVFM